MSLYHRVNVISVTLLNHSYRNFCTKLTERTASKGNNVSLIKKCLESVKKVDAGSSLRNPQNPENSLLKFEEMLLRRRNQARKSILVQVQTANVYVDLFDYCSQYGKVLSMHHYKLHFNQHFILVEFEKVSDADCVFDHAGFLEEDVLFIKSPILWFSNLKLEKRASLMVNPNPPLTVVNGYNESNLQNTIQSLQDTENVSQQMSTLYEGLKLDDLEIRLRFYTALQLEQCFSKIFPELLIYPFGSSVNGFGKRKCDLDIVLTVPKVQKNESQKLLYLAKFIKTNQKNTQKDFLMVAAQLMQVCIPGVNHVKKILDARVPILKFHHAFTSLECDFSVNNMTAIYMSELLYIYGELDPRVRPLVFTIRMWAREQMLTQSFPGRWITNFSLTLLVLFYLQQKSVIPAFRKLESMATHEDIRCTGDIVNCTFIRDIRKIKQTIPSNNRDTAEALLVGFFEYYVNFNYVKDAICIKSGIPVAKCDSSPLYICNPFNTIMNVSKNVNDNEIQRFVMKAREAINDLKRPQVGSTWGVISLFAKDKESRKFNVKGTKNEEQPNHINMANYKSTSNSKTTTLQ